MLRVSTHSLDDYEKLSTSRSDTSIILSIPGISSPIQLSTCRKSMCLQLRTNQHLGYACLDMTETAKGT